MANPIITHSKVSSGTLNPDVEVDLRDWNDQHVVTGLENIPNIDATNASNLSSGTVPLARLAGSFYPAPNTTTQALIVNQTLPLGTASVGTSYSGNIISVTDNGYESPEGSTGDPTFGLLGATSAFRVNYQSAGKGVPNIPIQIGGLFANAATGAGQQLVGLNSTVYSNINSSGNDSYWSIIGYAHIGPSANISSVYGIDAEVSVATGATVSRRIGVQANSCGPVTGSTIDAAFAITAQGQVDGAPLPFNNALVLWKSDGVTQPLGTSGSLIISNTTFTMGYGINLPNVTFANKIFDFGASVFQTDGSGNTTLGGAANAPAGITINNTSTGTAATASVTINNNVGQAAFGLAGSNYTTISQLANRAYIYSSSTNNGIILNAAGAKPIDFHVNGARAGGFTTAGLFTLTSPLGLASGGVNADLSGTGGTSRFLKQASAGAAITVVQPAFTDISGSVAASQLPNPSASTLGGIQSYAAVTSQWLRSISTSGVPASSQPAFSDLSGTISSAQQNAGQYPGTTTNNDATAGNFGEYIESSIAVGSAVSLTTSTAKTITSISLTAGDWDVTGGVSFKPANTTSATFLIGCISLVNNTLDTTVGRVVSPPMGAIVYDGSTSTHLVLPTCRFSLASTTTIYLIGFSTFTVSTNTGFGIIRARRVR